MKKVFKTLALFSADKEGDEMSYKIKDRKTGELFKELFPYGWQLDPNNRWMKLSEIMPWDELEDIYKKYFSHLGRPGKDSRLINGLITVKHKKVLSDIEVVHELTENIYIQYFCGYEQLVKNGEIHPSCLSKLRKKLGASYFQNFEKEILDLLKERKIIDRDELTGGAALSSFRMSDATVFPADIRYPTDTGLIEKARGWVVEKIKFVKKVSGIKEKIRTYCRVARITYLRFSKKRKRTVKMIRHANKKMLQYLRRNIEQLENLLCQVGDLTEATVEKKCHSGLTRIKRQLEIAKKIYLQQVEMFKNKTHHVGDRVVSFHASHIRPIVRGKSGKEVEFGPKCVLSLVDGYAFLDVISFDAFNEANRLGKNIELHKERFGRKPKTVIMDNIYGNRENRKMLKREGIRAALIPLGKRSTKTKKLLDWIKQKQRKRNRIEGAIGNSKTHYGLERILYRIEGGEEIWVRMGLTAMNLTTALARI